MALFTDGPAATIEGMREYESSILDVAAAEGIDLTVKLNVAHREVGIDLDRFFERLGTGTRENTVVTTPLATWETFHALVLTFRDAYHSQLNDRYLPKWREYEKRAQWASESLFQLGVGLTYSPVPRPGMPEVRAAAGMLPVGVYYVRTTWVGTGGESAPSNTGVLSALSPTGLEVRAGAAPAGVTGWNVYVGASLEGISLQTDAPLAIGSAWTAPEAGLRDGRPAGEGQKPVTFVKRSLTY